MKEKKLAQILDKYNIKYIFQKGFYVNYDLYIVDFYLPDSRICIEIDGIHHRYSKKQRLLDGLKERTISKTYGIKFLRFNNFEINESSEDKIIEKIKGETVIEKQKQLRVSLDK